MSFVSARLNELFEQVMAYEQSPGPGSFSTDLPSYDRTQLGSGPSARYTLLSPEEQFDKRSPEVQVNVAPMNVDTAPKIQQPSVAPLIRAFSKYSQGNYFSIPGDISLVSKAVPASDLPDYKVHESVFLNHMARVHGHFVLVNPSVFSVSVMARIWSDIEVCIPEEYERDYAHSFDQIMSSYPTRITVVNSTTKLAYLGSTGRIGGRSPWFSLQISPFARTVSSRSLNPEGIDYSFQRGKRSVPMVFPYKAGYFRTHLSALSGFTGQTDFFLLSGQDYKTVPYPGKTLVGYSTTPQTKSNSEILETVQRYGPHSVCLEGNVSVPSPVFSVLGKTVCYGDPFEVAYAHAKKKNIIVLTDDFRWSRAQIVREGEDWRLTLDPALEGVWVHVFHVQGRHSPGLFNRSFGKILNRLTSSYADREASYMAGVRYDDTMLLERVERHPVPTADVLQKEAYSLLDAGDVFVCSGSIVSPASVPPIQVELRDQVPPQTVTLTTVLRRRQGRPFVCWIEDWSTVEWFLDNGFHVQEVWPHHDPEKCMKDERGWVPIMVSWVRAYRAFWRPPDVQLSPVEYAAGAL